MSKPKETEKLLLPKEARLMMVSALESVNVIDADALSDEDILKQYNEYVLKMQARVNNLEMSQETKNINRYVSENDHMKLKDKEFIMRLFTLNIPSYYLHLFKDEHKELTDRELWKIINDSGIDPIKETSDLFKMRRSHVKQKAIQRSS